MPFLRWFRSFTFLDVFRALCVAGAMLIVVGIAGCGGGENTFTSQPFPEATQTQLNDALNRTRAAIGIPGVIISLSIPGEGTWETAVGVEDKNTQLPMQKGMHTRIGSITKTFTVTALLQLADDKRLQLDDPVSKYLDFVPNGSNITLRQMANMTSGLFSYTQDEAWVRNLFEHPDQIFTTRELVNVGFTHSPHFDPGTNINYSNSNTVLLGMVIEKVSGQKVEDFLAERIFRPLGLKNTSWPTTSALPMPFAHGYTEQTPNGQEADATFYNPSWANAAGQLVSNLDDLKVWAKTLGEGTLISPQKQRDRLTWVPFSSMTRGYGLGIGYFNGWIGHTGELPGYNTGVYYLPSKQAVLVIQTNSDIPLVLTSGNPPVEINPVPALFREIAKIVTPDNIPDGSDFTDDDLPEQPSFYRKIIQAVGSNGLDNLNH